MKKPLVLLAAASLLAAAPAADDPFPTLINPACSHCRDEAKRRAAELRPDDRVLCWTRGYSDGGAIPFRFFLNAYRVISDSYGVFVHDPDAGFARGFAPSYEFRFGGHRDGVMLLKHADGTVFSSLTGLALDGPKKGTRLEPVPTLVSDWGHWLDRYPDAVAYRMFDKYKAVEAPTKVSKSPTASDTRLKSDEVVLGVWGGKTARAYPMSSLSGGLVADTIDGEPLVVLVEPLTRTASAYRPVAVQPRKWKAPHPNAKGVSPPDEGEPLSGTALAPKALTIRLAAKGAPARFTDAETRSHWDIAGRCVSGELKGWTLRWVDSVQVKWFAWSAEHPKTRVYEPEKPDANKKMREVAGTAEFLRLLPKPFATLKAVDPKARTVTLLLDGDKVAKVWPVEPDAEVKVGGWWGRLEQFAPGDRVWAWLKLDRKKNPVSVVMLADEVSEFDMHGSLGEAKGKPKFAPEAVVAKRAAQKEWLRKRWVEEGLPGTLTFHHVFSGELEVTLDHEAMRWGRSLAAGDAVSLAAEPPIKGVVKAVTPWRERTVARLVVGELDASELKIGQRVWLKMPPPTEAVEVSAYPPDLGRPRTKAERVEWFLASIYCTCGVSRDICTGHFYTLASCNPNGCGLPKKMRSDIAEWIDAGKSDREILDEILKEHGPLSLKPHLLP